MFSDTTFFSRSWNRIGFVADSSNGISKDFVKHQKTPKKQAKSGQIVEEKENLSKFQCALCREKLQTLQDGEEHMLSYHRISMKNSTNPLIIRIQSIKK